ncbi:uncharacterized protein LOC136073134 [Hydra vulgaris]|uniref:uncharacterized protein LOC136073134 n=1 Tax=Hydra vulgaris TaxID=6087 RepID=UPI0032EA023F
MSKVKKIKENKKDKVKRKLFVKPVAIVKPYVPEGTYKIPQAYIPQVVETRPLERIDQEIYEDELEIFDDIPEIDDEQVRILDNIIIRIDRHLEENFVNYYKGYEKFNLKHEYVYGYIPPETAPPKAALPTIGKSLGKSFEAIAPIAPKNFPRIQHSKLPPNKAPNIGRNLPRIRFLLPAPINGVVRA